MRLEEEIKDRFEKSNKIFQEMMEVFGDVPLKEKVASFSKGIGLLSEIDSLSWVLDKKESDKINVLRKKLEEDFANLTRKQEWIK